MKSLSEVFLFTFLFISVKTLYPQDVPKNLDSLVQAVMNEFQVPGISLAIVKDGQVVLTRGYGIRQLGSSEKVDEKTLFGIASNSKAFTATAIAMLQEEGKLDWNDKVIDYLPWFRMSDEYITKELTVRDLLVHRSGLGLGAGDLLWWPPTTFTRQEISERLRYVPLTYSFRSTYAYDNVLFIIAADLIEAVSGMSWEKFITTRILNEVGFQYSTVLTYSDSVKSNIAATHAVIDGELQLVQPYLTGNANGAVGINSCAADMAKWMMVQLDSGRISENKRLFLPRSARQLWSLITPIPISKVPAELAPSQSSFRGYGLGFGVRDYRGEKMVSHTGALPGYLSQVTLLPDKRIGIAVFTNQESSEAFYALTNLILDFYLNAPKFDWIGGYKTLDRKSRKNIEKEKLELEVKKNENSNPSLPLKAYAGLYADKWYGEISVSEYNGKLEIYFMHTPSLRGELLHWQYNTFIARWYSRELRADAYVNFVIDEEGKIDSAEMKPVSSETDFSFDFQDLELKPVKN